MGPGPGQEALGAIGDPLTELRAVVARYPDPYLIEALRELEMGR